MMRSLFSAISGLKSHQTMMDVVGNNIANVNTTAYKTGRITFEDIISQTLRGAQAPGTGTPSAGGMNPMQVGLGVQAGAIDTITTQGNLQSTGKPTDLAIQGDGYFAVSDGVNVSYTRDGNFTFDANGDLVMGSNPGLRVTPDGTAAGKVNIPPADKATNISIGANGALTWVDSTGALKPASPLIINVAKFTNPASLSRQGNNLYQWNTNVGPAAEKTTLVQPGSGGAGSVQSGFLEMSNVDLSTQFTNMIIAQRGFQANSRVITASDQILEDLVNIKR